MARNLFSIIYQRLRSSKTQKTNSRLSTISESPPPSPSAASFSNSSTNNDTNNSSDNSNNNSSGSNSKNSGSNDKASRTVISTLQEEMMKSCLIEVGAQSQLSHEMATTRFVSPDCEFVVTNGKISARSVVIKRHNKAVITLDSLQVRGDDYYVKVTLLLLEPVKIAVFNCSVTRLVCHDTVDSNQACVYVFEGKCESARLSSGQMVKLTSY